MNAARQISEPYDRQQDTRQYRTFEAAVIQKGITMTTEMDEDLKQYIADGRMSAETAHRINAQRHVSRTLWAVAEQVGVAEHIRSQYRQALAG